MTKHKKISATSAAGVALASALLVSGCSMGSDPMPAPDTGTEQESEAPEDNAGSESDDSGATGDESASGLDVEVSWIDAIRTAQNEFDGGLTMIELDRENNILTYSIDLASDIEEFEIDIDATSGEVIKSETDNLDANDAAEEAADVFETDGLIEPSEAIATALKEVSGSAISWDLEREDTGIFYDVEVETSNDSVDVKIDAETGSIAEIDD